MQPFLPVSVLLLLALLSGCSGDEPAAEPAQALSKEKTCQQAEEVTDTYRDALGTASTPEDAREIVGDAITGLRELDAAPAVAPQVDGLADALEGLLAAVEAGRPPRELQPQAAAVGSSTTALAQVCGRAGQ